MIKQLYVSIPAIVIPLLFCVMNTPWLLPPPPAEATVEVADVFFSIFMGSIASVGMMLLPVIFYFLTFRQYPSWLRRQSVPVKDLCKDFFVVILFATTFMIILAPQEHQSNLTFLEMLDQFTIWQRCFIAFSICLGVPVCEEFLFRGVLIHLFKPKVGIFVSSVLFGLAHGLSIYTFPLVLTGWCFSIITYRTGSLFPTIFMHILFNTFNFILL